MDDFRRVRLTQSTLKFGRDREFNCTVRFALDTRLQNCYTAEVIRTPMCALSSTVVCTEAIVLDCSEASANTLVYFVLTYRGAQG